MKKGFFLSVIFIIFMVFSGCIEPKKEGDHRYITDDGKIMTDWCNPNIKIIENFTIIGITTYNDREVCQAVTTFEQGDIIDYFIENESSLVIIYKNESGDIIDKIDINPDYICEVNKDE